MNKQVIIDVPLAHVTDPSTVAQEVRDIHDSFEPDERAEALAAFVLPLETDLGSNLGELARDAAMRAIGESTDSDSDTVRKSLFGGKPDGDSFQLTVDAESGEVTDIQTVKRLREDKRATARSQVISDRTGYGPKKNDTSFRTDSVDPNRRR